MSDQPERPSDEQVIAAATKQLDVYDSSFDPVFAALLRLQEVSAEVAALRKTVADIGALDLIEPDEHCPDAPDDEPGHCGHWYECEPCHRCGDDTVGRSCDCDRCITWRAGYDFARRQVHLTIHPECLSGCDHGGAAQ